MSRILVTCATGFIGGNLLPRLVDGIHDVHTIVEETDDTGQLMADFPSVTVWRAAGGNEHIFATLGEIRPAVIYHLATYFVAQHQRVHMDQMVDSNLRFGVQIAGAAASLGPCHFINVATIWQHLGDVAYNPVSLYTSMKQAFVSQFIIICSLMLARKTVTRNSEAIFASSASA